MHASLIPGSNPASARFAESEVINGHLYVGGRLVECGAEAIRLLDVEPAELAKRPVRAQRTRRAELLNEGPVVVLNPDRKKLQFLVLAGTTWMICFEGMISRTGGGAGRKEPAWFECTTEGVVCWKGEETAAVALHELPKALKLLELAELELCNIADRTPVAPAQFVRAAIACLKPAVRS